MLSKKIQKLKPSAVQALAVRAGKLKEQGKNIINLSMGEPTWDSFDHSKREAISAIEKGFSGYSPAAGQMKLRQAIAKDANRYLNLNFHSSQVTVSIGSKYILFSALQALVNPDEEVLIPAPYWVSYPSMVDLVGGKSVIVPTDEKTHKLTSAILEKYLNHKTKVLILNSPNNPTSVVYSLDELKDVGQCLKKWESVYVLSDDIYNRMVLDDEPGAFAPHLLSVCPELKDRVVIVNAASKNYAMPGWRVGWAICQEPLVKAMSAFQSQTVSCSPTIAQMAMATSFEFCEMELKKVHVALKEKREKICKYLMNIKNLKFQYPQGAFYLWLDVRELFSQKYKDQVIHSSEDVFNILVDDYALFTVAGEEFGRGGYLRLHFAVEDSQIELTAQRLQKFISQIG